MALGRHRELRALSDHAETLAERLETRKVVDRAKGRLIDEKGMSESDAFAFIQHSAMSRRTTMRAVAQEILGQ
jgi:two-component system, response regulator PdtaR